MYSISSNGLIYKNYENFTNSHKKCDQKIIIKTKIDVNQNNFISNLNTECLTVPSKVFNGYGKKPFILSTVNRDCKDTSCSKGGHHSFQIFPFNLLNNNIYIDTIKPNFFSIVNTKNMKPDGNIILLNMKSKIKIINIFDLNNNDNNIFQKDKFGNLCHNPDDLTTLSKFNYSQEQIINYSQEVPKNNQKLQYKGNPIIYFFGDYVACDYSKRNFVNNLYVYFDYEASDNILATCLKKMKFTKTKSGNNKKDFLLPYSMNGTEYLDKNSRNFMINFDPREISYKDGFITIINTKLNIENFQTDNKSIYESYLDWKKLQPNGSILDFINAYSITNDIILDFLSNYIPTDNGNEDIDNFAYIISNNMLNMDLGTTIVSSQEILDQITTQEKIINQLNSSSNPPELVSYINPNTDPLKYSQITKSQENPVEKSLVNVGSISFNSKLLDNIIKDKRQCLKIKFWLVSFDFLHSKIINIKDKKGPFRYINFSGNPRIIIYIPPYLFKNDNKINKQSISSYYQSDQNICDIYVNISY